MHRTHTCGSLTATHIGQVVTLAGWVASVRNMGGLIFLDLRDRYGVTQISINPDLYHDSPIPGIAQSLKNEYVIKVMGEVVARPEGMTNLDISTGTIELVPTVLEILSTSKVLPFAIADDPKTSEEVRMKYRYLDLRRSPIVKNMEFRAKMNHFARNRFTEQGFLEIQTPLFTVSSPEGARDFVVPSRVNPGKFYALPQAPQQYKQLLMVGGLDKYFQLAPCFRDEDPRADRAMCEFYQIDFEMSFVEQQDVLDVLRSFHKVICAALVPHKTITVDFVTLTYREAMDSYGIDRPDLRFGLKLHDLTRLFTNSSFAVFKAAVLGGGVVKALKLDKHLMTRKEIDELTDVAKRSGVGGLAYLLYEGDEVKGSIAKFLSDEEIAAVTASMGAKHGDMVFFAAGSYNLVSKVLHSVRMALRDKYSMVHNDDLAFCFVVDFPFYEYDEKSDTRDFGHNPFSMIQGGLAGLAVDDLSHVMTHQYDLVLNGLELGSGSIRNHDPEVLVKAFEKIGRDPEEVKRRFGAMYEAFQYGCPPHGGFAVGFDRLMMLLIDEPSIKSVYAFPKSGHAEDVMMGAPSVLDDAQLDELGIRVKKDS